ncbi:MAG: CoA ester lyase [Burkholderiales bacterium]
MREPVTYLFVPGNRPDRFAKAAASGADALVLDLEDAVTPDAKEAAREHVAAWIATHPEVAERAVVRINDRSTPWYDADIAMLKPAGVRAVMLPKAEGPDAVADVVAAAPSGSRILPLVESALGVARVDAIASARGVARLVFGTLDYALDLDLSGDHEGLAYAAARIAIASRCAGLAGPVAGVTSAIDDETRQRDDVRFARAHGFTAKLCIHPRQVALAKALLQPGADEIAWARKVVAAAAAGGNAIQVDGRMVDRPVVQRAQSLLARAGD